MLPSCNNIYQERFYLFLWFDIAPEHAFRAHTVGFVELIVTRRPLNKERYNDQRSELLITGDQEHSRNDLELSLTRGVQEEGQVELLVGYSDLRCGNVNRS